MATLLLYIVFFMSLWFALRAIVTLCLPKLREASLRSSSVIAAQQEVSAEDYRIYLDAMEAMLEVPGPSAIRRSTSKTRRKSQPKSSIQNPLTSCSVPETPALTKQATRSNPIAKSASQAESRGQTRAALKAFLASRASPIDDRASLAQGLSNPLPGASRPPSQLTTSTHARPIVVENPTSSSPENRGSAVEDASKQSHGFHFLCLTPIRLVKCCLRVAVLPVLYFRSFAARLFTRPKPRSPHDAPLQSRAN